MKQIGFLYIYICSNCQKEEDLKKVFHSKIRRSETDWLIVPGIPETQENETQIYCPNCIRLVMPFLNEKQKEILYFVGQT